ncbi:hypothetical protein ACHAXA_006819 [Cyclostephanos tholiformis]|uniref:Centromere protein J C-terminal domain-containing protein n=1 Tax=Cyclostephanos tholiformis TaxID=382380 RepID=A0ABD3R6P3_9STRA
MTRFTKTWHLDDDDEDADDGLSDAAASLLRGPIMAARSSAIASGIDVVVGNEVPEEEEGVGTKENAKVDLNEFLAAEAIVVVEGGEAISRCNHHRRQHSDDTPYKVRNGFASPSNFGSTEEKKKYMAREQFLTSPHLQQHLLHPSLFEQQQQPRQRRNSISPSTARRDFVTSPQDSVSTLGALSPSEGYRRDDIVVDADCVGGGVEIFDVPDQMLRFSTGNSSNHACNRASTLIKTYTGGGDMTNSNANTPASKGDNNDGDDGRVGDTVSFLMGRIALGEEQMRDKNHSALAAAAPSTKVNSASSDHASDEPKKKPFLRKGTRKEPSALHSMTVTSRRNNNSNKNNSIKSSQSSSDCVTPSAARRSQQLNDNDVISTSSLPSSSSAAENLLITTGTPDPVAATKAKANANESLSERLARLARLEKMQDDLIKDLERRQARKEEAQKERRRMMTARNSQKAVAIVPVNTPAAAVVTRAISALAATTGICNTVVTPTHEQSRREAVASSCEGSGEHNNAQTFATPGAVQGGESQTGLPSQDRAERQEQEEDQEQEQQKSPSQVRAEQQQQNSAVKESLVTGNRESLTTQQQDGENIITPSQARRLIDSPASKKKNTSPSLDAIVDSYLSDWYSDDIEGKEVKFLGNEKENVDIKENQVVAKKGLKSNSVVEKAMSTSTPHPRSATSTARVKRSQSNTAAKLQSNGKASSSVNDDERKAFDEWKKEQWTLIKNMRRRQEVALREAEGERERAKAWAVTEKEAVQKWVTEQRSLIKKDRHKAANAALVASKAANRVRDAGNLLERKEMHSELEELRLRLKTTKEGGDAELKKLKEVIFRQEGTINALKCAKRDGSGGEGGVRTSKNSNVGHSEPITVRELCSSISKQDTLPQISKSKTPPGIISTKVQVSSKKAQGGKAVKFPAPSLEAVDDKTFGLTVELEEPTEHWLQRHLSKLTEANNNLGSKMTDGRLMNDTNCVRSEHKLDVINNDVDPQYEQQRKPYNAANYFPSQSLSTRIDHHSNPIVPLFVTSAVPCLSHHATKPSSENGVGEQSTTSRIFTYNNGTRKEVSPDGTTTISFANGDRKRTYANEKKGVVVYYYASTKTTQVTHQDGMQTYHFPNKQVENHHTDGSKEITFPDGTTRIVHTDGSTDTTFPDGIRVIEDSDGNQRVIQAV